MTRISIPGQHAAIGVFQDVNLQSGVQCGFIDVDFETFVADEQELCR
jgi:hypothetical protein